MGITATAIAPGGDASARVYLRIDGLRVGDLTAMSKPLMRSWDEVRTMAINAALPVVPESDPALVPVAFTIYAYVSGAARSERAAPLWSMPFHTTIGLLALPTTYTPADLWGSLYAMLLAAYPDSADDLVVRFPVAATEPAK